MEVIERAQYDSCITGDNNINGSGGFHQNDRLKKNVSDSGTLVGIKQETDYVASSDVNDSSKKCEISPEKGDKIGRVNGNFFQNSLHLNENISGLLSNRTSVKQIVENKIP